MMDAIVPDLCDTGFTVHFNGYSLWHPGDVVMNLDHSAKTATQRTSVIPWLTIDGALKLLVHVARVELAGLGVVRASRVAFAADVEMLQHAERLMSARGARHCTDHATQRAMGNPFQYEGEAHSKIGRASTQQVPHEWAADRGGQPQ
jgi:hypothetical protein